jgi:hypothetical protein
MSSPDGLPTGSGSHRIGLMWVVFVAAVIIAVVTVVAISVASAGNQAEPSASPTATAGSPGAGSSRSAAPGKPSAMGTNTPAPAVPAPGEPPIVAADPIPIEATAQPDPGVSVSVGGFEAVQGEAQFAGDVAGPAIRFKVSVTNGTAATVSLATTLVNVFYGAGQSPASELQKPGAVPLPAEVAPGATATGTVVFTVPEDERDDVLITVDYRVGDPVIAFRGATPR